MKQNDTKHLSQIAWPYSGSRYPTVPRTILDTWDPSTAGFDSPKSATFALMFLSRRMLLLFRSLWIIVGEHPVWRYSIPDFCNFTFRIRTVVANFSIFNIQVVNCETSRPQTFCRIFCNLKTLQPASYLYIISSCETPPKVYPHLYMFSLFFFFRKKFFFFWQWGAIFKNLILLLEFNKNWELN